MWRSGGCVWAFLLASLWLMATVSSETLIEVDENGDEYELKRFYIQGRQLRGDGSQSQCVVTRRKRNSRALTTFGTANRNISVTSQPLKVEAMPGKEHREGEQDLEVKHRYVALTGVHFEPNVQDDDEDDDEDFEDEEDNVPVNSPKGESNFVPAALALPLASAAGASPAVQTSQSHLAQGVSVVANSASHANVAGDAGIVVVQSHQPPKVNPDTHAVFELKPVQADTPGYPFVHPWEYEPDDEDDYDEEDYDDFYYGSDYRDHNGYYPLGEYDELVHEEINPVTTTAYWSTGDDDSDIHPVINQANKRPNQGQKNKKKNKKNNNQKQKQNQKNRNQLQKRRKQQQAAENQQKQKKKPEKNQQDKKKDPKDQKDKEEEELQGVKPVDVIKKPESSSMTESSASAASSSSTSSQSSVSNSSDKKKPKKKKKKPSSSSSISSSTSVRRKKKKPSSSSSSLSSSSNKRRRPSSSSSSSNIGGYRRRRPQQQQQQQQQRLQDQRRRRRRQQQQKRRRQQQQQQKRRRQQQQRRRRLGNKNRQFYGDEPIINCIYINKDPPTTTTTTARPFWNILGRQSQDSAPAAPKDNGAVAAVAPASESDASDVDPAAQQAVLQAVRRNFGEFGGRKRVNLRFVS